MKSSKQIVRERMMQFVDEQMSAMQCEVERSGFDLRRLREDFAAEYLRREGILFELGIDTALREADNATPPSVDDEDTA